LIETPATSHQVLAPRSPYTIHSVDASHPRIGEIIEEILALQKTLLINKLPIEEIKKEDIEKGFLVGESTFDSVLKSLKGHNGELILVCSTDDSGADILAGYAVLTEMSDFRAAIPSEEFGVFSPTIATEAWESILESRTMHYIHQIAVHSEMRTKGIGSVLLEACKARSPHGVAADILFWPEPFNNMASYMLFLKRGFTDIGTLFIKVFPAFKQCKTHFVVWTPERDT
jgi:GNAT superfamily N-acetyltransferase